MMLAYVSWIVTIRPRLQGSGGPSNCFDSRFTVNGRLTNFKLFSSNGNERPKPADINTICSRKLTCINL